MIGKTPRVHQMTFHEVALRGHRYGPRVGPIVEGDRLVGDGVEEASSVQSGGLLEVSEARRHRAGDRLPEIRPPDDTELPARHFG